MLEKTVPLSPSSVSGVDTGVLRFETRKGRKRSKLRASSSSEKRGEGGERTSRQTKEMAVLEKRDELKVVRFGS